MQTNNTTLPNSRLQLEFELPPERLEKAIGHAVSHLSRQASVPGFRPGKAPRVMLERVVGQGAVLEEALDLLVNEAYREAVREQGLAPLTSPEVEITQGEEGKPVLFKAVIQVSPEVKLGDYANFGFKPEIAPVDETMVEKVVEELRDSEGRLEPVIDRGAQLGDFAIVAMVATRDGKPFPGGTSERVPLKLGQNRLIPGFDEQLYGAVAGDERSFELSFPDDYEEESLRGQPVNFHVTLKDLHERVLPEPTDEFAKSVSKFATMAELTAELRLRLEANAVDRARHDFADKIIDYATANATLELPDILVDQELDVMRDELRSTLSRQGISEDEFLKVSKKTSDDINAELRPDATKRVKTLLVLTEVAKARGVEVSPAEVEAEVAQARARYADSPSVVKYFESERGRNYIKGTLRRSSTVELIIDEWLAAHPEFPRLVHLEDALESSPVAALAGENPVPADSVAAALAAEAAGTGA